MYIITFQKYLCFNWQIRLQLLHFIGHLYQLYDQTVRVKNNRCNRYSAHFFILIHLHRRDNFWSKQGILKGFYTKNKTWLILFLNTYKRYLIAKFLPWMARKKFFKMCVDLMKQDTTEPYFLGKSFLCARSPKGLTGWVRPSHWISIRKKAVLRVKCTVNGFNIFTIGFKTASYECAVKTRWNILGQYQICGFIFWLSFKAFLSCGPNISEN